MDPTKQAFQQTINVSDIPFGDDFPVHHQSPNDILSLRGDPMDTCVPQVLEDDETIPPSEMKPLMLPNSYYGVPNFDQLPGFPFSYSEYPSLEPDTRLHCQQTSQFAPQPLPERIPQPVASTSTTDNTRRPMVGVRTPATRIAPRTPHSSPLSIATPVTTYSTTPDTTPVSNVVPLPVPPVSEHIAVFSAAVDPIPEDIVQAQFAEVTKRVGAMAEERKLVLREQLKRAPTCKHNKSKASAQREARVTRRKVKETRLALENEVKTQLHNVCVLLAFIEKYLPDAARNTRKRARTE